MLNTDANDPREHAGGCLPAKPGHNVMFGSVTLRNFLFFFCRVPCFGLASQDGFPPSPSFLLSSLFSVARSGKVVDTPVKKSKEVDGGGGCEDFHRASSVIDGSH